MAVRGQVQRPNGLGTLTGPPVGLRVGFAARNDLMARWTSQKTRCHGSRSDMIGQPELDGSSGLMWGMSQLLEPSGRG